MKKYYIHGFIVILVTSPSTGASQSFLQTDLSLLFHGGDIALTGQRNISASQFWRHHVFDVLTVTETKGSHLIITQKCMAIKWDATCNLALLLITNSEILKYYTFIIVRSLSVSLCVHWAYACLHMYVKVRRLHSGVNSFLLRWGFWDQSHV